MRSVIVSACRTPIGAFLGGLASLTAPELGAVAIREAVRRAGLAPEEIDETLFGCVLTAGVGQAPARQAAIGAGIPHSVGATTINKVCGSGLMAVMLADQAIRAGDAQVIMAGGMESMSSAPYLLPKHARTGLRFGDAKLIDSAQHDGLCDAYHQYSMGCTGELCAREYHISREEQDAYAARSYERALAAQEAGAFDRELTPVEVSTRKGFTVVDRDEEPRPTTIEALAKLRPAFEQNGTVTAGNASTLNDGAAALIVMAEAEAERRGLTPLARIMATAGHAREPEWLMMAPEGAIRNVLQKAGWTGADVYEINEPFAVAPIALIRELKLDDSRVNVHGGAVALGHPIGASGARILVTLLHTMEQYGHRTGIASLCLGGGEAVAVAVERAG